jgi:hypothetical protein
MRRKTLRVIAVTLPVLLGACTKERIVQPVLVPVPQTPAIQQTVRLEATEADESGKTRQINDSVRSPVDVNSSVLITPQVGALPGRADTTRAANLRRRIEYLSNVYDAVHDSLKSATSVIVKAQHEFLLAPDAAKRTQSALTLDKAFAAKGSLLLRLRAAADSVDPAAADQILNVMPPDVTAQLMSLVSDRTIRLLDSLKIELDAIAAAGRYQVEMTAVRYSPGRLPEQLHLPGYDNLGPGDPLIIDKLSFARTQEEQAQLDRSTAAIGQLVRNARSVSDVARNLTTTASESAEGIASAIDALRVQLRELPSDITLARLTDTIPKIAGDAAAKELVSAVNIVSPLVKQVRELQNLVANTPGELRKNPTLMGPFDMLRAWTEQTKKLIPTIESTASQLRTAGDALLPKAIDLAGKLKTYRQGLDTAQLRRFESVAGPTLDRIGALVDSVQAARSRVEIQVKALKAYLDLFGTFSSADAASAQGEATLREVLQVSIGDAGRTTLDLVRADRRAGDHVLVTLRVIDPATSHTVSMPAELSLDITTFGWHRRWAGGLAFAKDLDEPAGTKPGMKPGVSASWIAHYSRRRDQTTGWAYLQSLFDPKRFGLGLTSVMFTRDDRIELGFGPTLTTLGDLLQVGAGLNLQTEKWYVLLNTPLLELFRRGSGPE